MKTCITHRCSSLSLFDLLKNNLKQFKFDRNSVLERKYDFYQKKRWRMIKRSPVYTWHDIIIMYEFVNALPLRICNLQYIYFCRAQSWTESRLNERMDFCYHNLLIICFSFFIIMIFTWKSNLRTRIFHSSLMLLLRHVQG